MAARLPLTGTSSEERKIFDLIIKKTIKKPEMNSGFSCLNTNLDLVVSALSTAECDTLNDVLRKEDVNNDERENRDRQSEVN